MTQMHEQDREEERAEGWKGGNRKNLKQERGVKGCRERDGGRERCFGDKKSALEV